MEEENSVIRVVEAVAVLAEPLINLLDIFPLERPIVVRNENYFEQTISNYSNIQFREHFRMSRETFNVSSLFKLFKYETIATSFLSGFVGENTRIYCC